MARFAAILAVSLFYFGQVFGNWAAVWAQEAHQRIRPSLVFLKAAGQVRTGPNASQHVETLGTGFLVSSDGLVLTTYHLISELGDAEPSTVEIEGRIADKSADARPVAIVDAAITTDLLLLKLPPGAEDYVPVSLGSAYDHDEAEGVFTSGFPRSISYIKQAGTIQATEGPGGYLWTTDLQFNHGQSGSPVYDAAARVIGIVKGDKEGHNFMIPIDFADGLIVHVRIKEIRARLDELEGIVRNPQRTGQDRQTDCPKIKGGEERYTLVLNQEVTLLDGKFRVRLTDMRRDSATAGALVGTIQSNAFSQRPIRNREAIGFVINAAAATGSFFFTGTPIKCKYTMLPLSMKLDSVEIALLDY